ncbi:dioxygenase family protein [Altibacter sp. HG106]|uniref:dioxygenase family protein n=1 Tax=Altibacter sp. HG106 TaxID=3023937 RepID=UPI0023504F16|nr:intradiol ring-cleavage dioxygenase [Altibacter sp. HG106]MDC7995670.1 intradiol ring-cleavage dioxygenase [Altibacter sp. HG106]
MTLLKHFWLICLVLVPHYSCTNQIHPNNEVTTVLPSDFDTHPPFYYKMPEGLTAIDTSAGWKEAGQKIVLTGIVYKADGITPAADVLLYYYHTNPQGVYEVKPEEPLNMPKNELGQTHGYLRGWVQTGRDGTYRIHTLMPGSYPSRAAPAHIHVYVKEPNMKAPYYLDDFVFDHDPLLTSQERAQLENRGGSGIIRFVQKKELWIGERNLYLGRNIPEYPKSVAHPPRSGKPIGEDLASFTPYHAYGPDAGTTVCPICKYGWYHGILYFVGTEPDWESVKKWLLFLDQESRKRKNYLKVYFVYGNPKNFEAAKRMETLSAIGNELDLQQVALTFVPSFLDTLSGVHKNAINPSVSNTFLLYKRSNVIGNFNNFEPIPENFQKLQNTLNATTNEWFPLSPPTYEQ